MTNNQKKEKPKDEKVVEPVKVEDKAVETISSEIKVADASITTTAKVPESVVEEKPVVPKENKNELEKRR